MAAIFCLCSAVRLFGLSGEGSVEGSMGRSTEPQGQRREFMADSKLAAGFPREASRILTRRPRGARTLEDRLRSKFGRYVVTGFLDERYPDGGLARRSENVRATPVSEGTPS